MNSDHMELISLHLTMDTDMMIHTTNGRQISIILEENMDLNMELDMVSTTGLTTPTKTFITQFMKIHMHTKLMDTIQDLLLFTHMSSHMITTPKL